MKGFRDNIIVFVLAALVFLTGVPSLLDAQFLIENKNYNLEETSEELATVYIKKFDRKTNKLINEPITKITKDKAIQLRETLQEIWEDNGLSSKEKTIQQLHILYDENILPSDIPIDEICRYINDIIKGM